MAAQTDLVRAPLGTVSGFDLSPFNKFRGDAPVDLIRLKVGPGPTTRPDPLYFKKLGVPVCESRNPGLAGRTDRPCSGPS
jgi:hypothetical protein